jgi:hypothetical protein
MDFTTSIFAPHPQPLSLGRGEQERVVPLLPREKGLGDEGSARRIASNFIDVI